VDTVDERGYFWEADLNTKVVKLISDNWLLKKKYGITPLRQDSLFGLADTKTEEVRVLKNILANGIVYHLEANIKNNSDKTITKATIQANLVVIYSEQKILEKGANVYLSSFDGPTTDVPWKPGELRHFVVFTDPIETIYKEYKPTDAFCF